MSPGNRRIAILTGPTATGKTELALGLAGEHSARGRGTLEIVNADSLLIYRGMDVGTAKPTPAQLVAVRHHLIDLRDPSESFTAGDFRREALAAIADIEARGNRALVVGGTGFYLKALLYGMWDVPPADPELKAALSALTNAELHAELLERDEPAAWRIGPNDRYRLVRAVELLRQTGRTPTELQEAQARVAPDPRFALFVIDRPSAELESRVSARVGQMLGHGLVEETRELHRRFPGARPLRSVGYAQVIDHLEGRLPVGRKVAPGLEGLRAEIELATRQLVKSQRTWFRSEKAATAFELDRERERLLGELRSIYGEG